MPPEVGNVQRFIHGTFVSFEVAHASWLALTVKHASMCYLAKADDKVICVPIGATVPENTVITYRHPGADLAFLEYRRQEPYPADRHTYYLEVRTFAQAIMEASGELNTMALQRYQANPRRGAMKPLTVDENPVDASDGQQWAPVGDGGVWEPPVIDANEGWGWGYAKPPIDHPDGSFFPGADHLYLETVAYQPPQPGWYDGYTTLVPGWTTCRFVGWVIDCVTPRAPSMTGVPPIVPPAPPPSIDFTFNLCHATFGAFCSASDEVKRAEDLDLRIKLCERTRDEAIDGCWARKSDYRTAKACEEKEIARYGDCVREARKRNSELYDD